jgi:nucleoside 2-deoxyribosyltransferase
MAIRKRFNPIKYYSGGGSAVRKPLTVKAPSRKYAQVKAPPQLSTAGHLWDKGGKFIADLINSNREEGIRSADQANVEKMIEALTAPRTAYDPDKYGTSSEDLMVAAGGYSGIEEDGEGQYLSDEAQREFYTEEADRVRKAYETGEPAGADLVRQQAKAGEYNMPTQSNWLAEQFGAKPRKGRMGDRSSDLMMKILLGDQSKTDAAEAAELKRSQGIKDYENQKRIDAKYKEQKIDKYGTPFVVADKNSSTGYSRVQINQAGAKRTLGEAASPTKVFDPDAARKKSLFSGRETRYDVSMAKLNEADEIIGNVNQMWNLVQNVDSGSLAEWGLELKKFANNFKFTFDKIDIANAEAMRSKGMDFILQRIQKTKGAISEKEMAAFKQASASLANTKEGNEMILNLSRSVAERMKAEAGAVREAYSKNPNMGRKELDDAMLKARKDYGPLWTPPIKPPKGFDPKVWYNMTKEQRVEYTRLGGGQ